MKFLTTNFVKCSVKSCDSTTDSFPLGYDNCKLVQTEQEFKPDFILSILERLDWNALIQVAKDLGNESLPPVKPEGELLQNEDLLKDLHTLLIETTIIEGEMICNNCKHVYYIKNSIPNFLLPPHLA
ncbi:hypothetical protein WICMUC_005421 [Wickerhamomyces mucosus]|uniref:Multifunctional methyltransferase subunit trm112 n=1 Tax=Wickerhamomyces mucosus TaxID=1378264 RepID=A0A9P8P8V8_9ASCO|nr:hypothetical protein WICMUC_005421 [Wickerhamomyces mucosus]